MEEMICIQQSSEMLLKLIKRF